MQKTTLASVALALILSAGAASAADLPTHKAPPYIPPPVMTWTGFYAGVNAGYTWSNSNAVNLASFPGPCDPLSGGGCTAAVNYSLLAALGATGVANAKSDGFIGGGQVGYNWQFMNSFVAGVEADIQGIAGSNSAGVLNAVVPSPAFPAQPVVSFSTVNRSLDYLGTVRARVGYLFTPSLLVYATGGLAYGGVNLGLNIIQHCIGCGWTIPPVGSASFSDTRVGWAAGGGVEYMMWQNWSAKLEYMYYDLGNVSVTRPIIGTNPANGPLFLSHFPTARARFDGHIVRAGVNYHFNWGAAPVVAKY